MLDLYLEKRAQRFIEKLLPKHAGQISDKIGELQKNPFPQDYKRVKQSPYFRVDSGEYRIVYQVIGNTLYVPLVGKRNDDEVYRRLRRLQ